METERSEALTEDYYVANFHALAMFVSVTYTDILGEHELSWYRRIRQSSTSAQRLYIRLVTRRRSVFRLSKLKYPEISHLHKAADELASAGLASTQSPESLATLTGAFTRPELLKLLALDSKRSLPRSSLIEQIIDSTPALQSLYQARLQQADQWISLNGHEHWILFRLCFFGNLYQDASEFVLRETGAVNYEQYAIDKSSRAFQSRAQVDAHLRYFECEALLDTISLQDSSQLSKVISSLPQMIGEDLNLQRRLDRIRNRIARQFERLNLGEQAATLYRQSIHPPARERRCRLHLAVGELTEAKRLTDEMLSVPFNEAELQTARRLQHLVDKANGISVKAVARFRPDTTKLTLEPSADRVEHAAQQFYSRFGQCYYCENSLVCGVLGLFIWDIIFHPVKGAFFNPFQYAPSDFYEPSFIRTRKHLLEQRFRELEQPLVFSSRIINAHEQHSGKANPLIRWGQLSIDLLSAALQRIPPAHWLVLFDRMLEDLRNNTSGLPDLVLFREQGGYEFIEIKGPGDTLQHNQRRWMKYFDENRIPCRVVNVRWADKVANEVNGS